MARFGKLPVSIPEGVTVSIEGKKLTVTGPKGAVNKDVHPDVEIKVEGNEAFVKPKRASALARALQGTYKSHLTNMVKGVSEGWAKTLEISGAGYRSDVQGKKLNLNVGFSHPVVVEAPEGIDFKVEKSVITVSGIDKDLVGHISALIRKVRPPEPYKGAGIKYTNEIIRRKAGKQAAKGA